MGVKRNRILVKGSYVMGKIACVNRVCAQGCVKLCTPGIILSQPTGDNQLTRSMWLVACSQHHCRKMAWHSESEESTIPICTSAIRSAALTRHSIGTKVAQFPFLSRAFSFDLTASLPLRLY
jgi:hypothetical protein